MTQISGVGNVEARNVTQTIMQDKLHFRDECKHKKNKTFSFIKNIYIFDDAMLFGVYNWNDAANVVFFCTF